MVGRFWRGWRRKKEVLEEGWKIYGGIWCWRRSKVSWRGNKVSMTQISWAEVFRKDENVCLVNHTITRDTARPDHPPITKIQGLRNHWYLCNQVEFLTVWYSLPHILSGVFILLLPSPLQKHMRGWVHIRTCCSDTNSGLARLKSMNKWSQNVFKVSVAAF